MQSYKITFQSIKNLKASFDYADNYADNNVDYSGYSVEFNNEELLNSYNEKANNEAKLIAEVLNIQVGVVIDMAYDFDFAKEVLNKIYA